MDEHDFSLLIKDVDAAWKCVSTLSPEEIFSRISNNETRVSDVIGVCPREVSVALGEEFVPPQQLAQFRGKFGEAERKTVFESWRGCQFGLEYLWGDLLAEIRKDDPKGHVGLAIREALVRMEKVDSWEFLATLEAEARRSGRSCRRNQQEQQEEESLVVGGGVIMDWVTRDLQWNSIVTFHRFLHRLPFFLRYCGTVELASLSSLLSNCNLRFPAEDLIGLLQTLVILSSPRHHDNDPPAFSILSAFLRKHLNELAPAWKWLAEVFLGATREQISEATCPSLCLVGDVCVGGVFLNLLNQQGRQIRTQSWEKTMLETIVCDVIMATPCCDLPAMFQLLRGQMQPHGDQLAMLKWVLTSYHVLTAWKWRFEFDSRRENADVVMCGVTHFLSFYFSVFGLTLDWMRLENGKRMDAMDWILVGRITVEISNALRGDPHWTHLLPQFQEILREHLRGNFIVKFSYKTEGQWETLLPLINAVTLPPGNLTKYASTLSPVAAPLLRALIKLYGIQSTKSKLTTNSLWNAIPFHVFGIDGSVGSLGSLLHSAIELGELEEVKKRAFPGLVKWRNGEGRTALELAREKYDEAHPIRTHLEQRTLSIKKFN